MSSALMYVSNLTFLCFLRYKPSLSLEFVQELLGFSDVSECKEFLTESGMKFTADQTKIDCKESQVVAT